MTMKSSHLVLSHASPSMGPKHTDLNLVTLIKSMYPCVIASATVLGSVPLVPIAQRS